jgi:hypothetical protein
MSWARSSARLSLVVSARLFIRALSTEEVKYCHFPHVAVNKGLTPYLLAFMFLLVLSSNQVHSRTRTDHIHYLATGHRHSSSLFLGVLSILLQFSLRSRTAEGRKERKEDEEGKIFFSFSGPLRVLFEE